MQVAFDITALLLAICPERKKKCVCLCAYTYKGTLIASTFCITKILIILFVKREIAK